MKSIIQKTKTLTEDEIPYKENFSWVCPYCNRSNTNIFITDGDTIDCDFCDRRSVIQLIISKNEN